MPQSGSHVFVLFGFVVSSRLSIEFPKNAALPWGAVEKFRPNVIDMVKIMMIKPEPAEIMTDILNNPQTG